ncbi:MAG: sulfurtransferase TusA family protein [Elusimicrobia bacterium]|nr:sulfurtransferase TusA family protein [Elusimicrobiota bacterium]
MPPEAETHRRIDSRGEACPGPITDLALAYRRAKDGDVLELWATDPGVRSDVRAWAERTGSELLSVEDRDGAIVSVLRVRRRRP